MVRPITWGGVYLASDQVDVSGSLNGYFIQFGEGGSDDAIELFQQNGLANISVCRGTEGLISGSFEMRVRVRRDPSGNWEIGIDQNGGTDFLVEATGTENTVTSTTNFGLLCTYTASNSTGFYYDDLYLGPYILDVTPPEISALSIISATELDVQFNEPISQATAETVTNYAVNNSIGNPLTAMLEGGDPTLVHITFGSAFTNGTQYELTVSDVQDVAGNTITASVEPFLYVIPVTAGFRDVVINEFVADPSPVIGLPEGEYIEVFNISSNFIDLEGWKLSDGSSTGTVGAHIMAPGEYALLVSTSDMPLFGFFGNVVPVTSFPSLNNSGDMIILKNELEDLVDRVNYDLSWYQDEAKESGGYSLEQINPFLSCSKAQNWIGSEHFNGGTPNVENSVFDNSPDIIGPSLISISVIGSAELLLTMDEPLDSSLVTTSSVVIEPIIGVLSTQNPFPDYTTIDVLLSANIDTGVYYTATVTGLLDCEGNPQAADSSQMFVLPFTADSGDFVLNEVLFNPFTGGVDYIELVNNTERVLNLKGWQLANFDEEDGISGQSTIINTNYPVESGGYVLITEDTTDVAMNYIQHGIGNFIQANLPSYNNDSGTVYLLNVDSIVAERFKYDEEMHFPLLSDVNGVSLERLDVNRSVNDAGNWHSAAETAGFGTPGRENSQYYPTSGSDGEVSTDPEIFSPDNDGYNDVLNINFTFTEPGNVATIRIYDANGRPTKELATNELLGASGTFTWDGTTDKGEKARIGMYIILFESFNTTGKTNTYKLSTVLGGHL